MAQTHITLAKLRNKLAAANAPVAVAPGAPFVPPKGSYKKDDGKYYRFGKLLPGQ